MDPIRLFIKFLSFSQLIDEILRQEAKREIIFDELVLSQESFDTLEAEAEKLGWVVDHQSKDPLRVWGYPITGRG